MNPEPTRDPNEPIPPLSLLFGYGPMALILLAGLGGWLLPGLWSGLALAAGWLFASAILLFLAGVVRGLSFFSPGGPRPAQLAMMLWLFLLGFGSVAGAISHPMWIGFALLILGYGSLAVYDPQAARAGLAPGYFARLRPRQMGIALVGLSLLLLRALMI
jgi:hypothetical protein